jgi:2-haloacid dehalogenase
MRVEVVVFDAYGTLFDVYSVGQLADTLYPGQGAAIAALWRDKQLEYSRLVSLSDPSPGGSRHYLDFWQITQRALRYALARVGAAHQPAHEAALMAQYRHLTPFPENAAVLQRVQELGLSTAILSNANRDMLDAAAAAAGYGERLDAVLSVDAVRHFKTTPASYQLVLERFAVDPQAVLFVSSNGWDVMGATWFGFRTLWVNRAGLPPETIGPLPTFEGRSLSDVLRMLDD